MSRVAPMLALAALVAMAPASPAHAQGPDAVVSAPLRAAFAGDLDAATAQLEQLATSEQADALVLWNLAAVYTRDDRLGRALWALLRLERADPPLHLGRKGETLRAAVQSKLVEKARRSGDPNVFALRDARTGLERWAEMMSEDAWRWLALIAFWLGCCALIGRRLTPPSRRAAVTTVAALTFAICAVAQGSDLAARHLVERTRIAVVVEDGALLRESLVQGSSVRALPEGVVVVVREMITETVMAVRLPDGRTGYIDTSGAAPVP